MKFFLNVSNKEKGIALYDDTTLYGIVTWNESGNEAGHVLPAMMQLLGNAQKNLSDITDCVVILGPGSFTGLRVLMTVLNTLSFEYPAITMRTLTVGDMFAQSNTQNMPIVFQVYASDIFTFSPEGAYIGRYAVPHEAAHLENLRLYGEVMATSPYAAQTEQAPALEYMTLPFFQAGERAATVHTGPLIPFYAKGANISTPKT